MVGFQHSSIHWNLNYRFGRLVFEKTKKNIGPILHTQTFSKAVDRKGKQKQTRGVCRHTKFKAVFLCISLFRNMVEGFW